MYGIREDTVSRHIKKLKEVGFIKCLYGKDTNNKSARIIYLTDNIWDKWLNNNCTNNQAEVGHISRHNNNINSNILDETISYDEDGVMLWHGKRCEAIPCILEEQHELEDILSKYRSDSIE